MKYYEEVYAEDKDIKNAINEIITDIERKNRRLVGISNESEAYKKAFDNALDLIVKASTSENVASELDNVVCNKDCRYHDECNESDDCVLMNDKKKLKEEYRRRLMGEKK